MTNTTMNEQAIIDDLISKILHESDTAVRYDLIMAYNRFLETIKLKLDIEAM